MTTTPPPPQSPQNPAPQQAPNAPLIMHGQYIKDLSFENPRAPQSLIEQTQPQLTLNVQVTNRQFDTKTFEVALTIEASAKTPKDEPLFMLELVYAGTVTLGEVPQEAVGPLLFIETPRLLFPFARAVVANATREAGFPPLNIAPVDFVALYRQQLEAQRRQDAGRRRPAPSGTPRKSACQPERIAELHQERRVRGKFRGARRMRPRRTDRPAVGRQDGRRGRSLPSRAAGRGRAAGRRSARDRPRPAAPNRAARRAWCGRNCRC